MGTCLLAGAVHAQAVVAPGPSPEEITVTGQRSLPALDRQIGAATESFWKLLNRVLDDPGFAITCENFVPTGSRLRERICLTRYTRDDLAAAGEAFVRRQPSPGIAARIGLKNRELNDRILVAVNTSPELHAAVLELARLKAEYTAAATEESKGRGKQGRRGR